MTEQESPEITNFADVIGRIHGSAAAHAAGDFLDRVHTTGHFTWLGAVQYSDELSSPCTNVYLLDSDPSYGDYKGMPDDVVEQLDVIPSFTALADVVRPWNMYLYFLDGRSVTPEMAKKRLPELPQSPKPGRTIFTGRIVRISDIRERL